MTRKTKIVSTILVLFFVASWFTLEVLVQIHYKHFSLLSVFSAVFLALSFLTEIIKKLRVWSFSAVCEYFIICVTDFLCMKKNTADCVNDQFLEIMFILIYLIVSLILLLPSKWCSKYVHLKYLQTAPKTAERVSKALLCAHIAYICSASVVLILKYIFAFHGDIRQIGYVELLIWAVVVFIPFQLLALAFAFAAKRDYGKLIT